MQFYYAQNISLRTFKFFIAIIATMRGGTIEIVFGLNL